MKSKWKWFYNPFEYVAGWKAFGLGAVLLGIATVMGYFGHTVFFALEVKVVPEISWSKAFFLQGLGLGITVTVMYVSALLFNRRTRFQDILGTVTMAKYPLLLMALLSLALGKGLAAIETSDIINNRLTINDYAMLGLFSIVTIILFVWEITLLYNAFRVSTNLKNPTCAILFASALVITEIATLILVAHIY